MTHTNTLSICLLCSPRIYCYNSYLFDRFLSRSPHPGWELDFVTHSKIIRGTEYSTSRVLYDVGAGAVCSHGPGSLKFIHTVKQIWLRVSPCIRDCQVENREGTEMEHIIAALALSAIGHDEFCEYFADVRGDPKAGTKHSVAFALSYRGRLEHPQPSRGTTRSTTDSIIFLRSGSPPPIKFGCNPTVPATAPLPVRDRLRQEGHVRSGN